MRPGSVDFRTEILFRSDGKTYGRKNKHHHHRLSTIRNADLILVMNNGDIVEIEKHQNY